MVSRAPRKKLSIWAYYVAGVTVVLVSLATLTWYSNERYREFLVQQLRITLEDRASIVAARMNLAAGGGYSGVSNGNCRIAGSVTDIRISVIAADGTVLCDSEADITSMNNHRSRPEIASAFEGRVESSTRYSDTLSAMTLYVAVPVERGIPVRQVVRASMPLSSVNALLSQVTRTVNMVSAALAFAALVLSIYLYRKINSPLHRIVEGANNFAQGNFELKLDDYDIREIDNLASTMNRMADRLQLLERIRQDFVANVSHELKTPITSIKGFVETLRDGAKDNPQDLDRFLHILERQSQRMEAIVDDLLTLSRLEGEPASEVLHLHHEDLRNLLASARDYCLARAESKHIDIVISCEPGIKLIVDRSLLTQALINLVDNAIKYSPADTQVSMSGMDVGEGIRIDIADQGHGIPAKHFPRLFERFYRVDKARSRKLGGTGLGLAIVKHIVVLHGGSVSVDSKPDSGSVFHIDIPNTAGQRDIARDEEFG